MNFDKEVFITLENRIYITLQIALTGKRIMDQFLEDFRKVKAEAIDQPVFGNLALRGRVVIERNSPTSCFISGYFKRLFKTEELNQIREDLAAKYGCAIVQMLYRRQDGVFVIDDGGCYDPETSDCETVPELPREHREMLRPTFLRSDIPDFIRGQNRLLIEYALELRLDYTCLKEDLERLMPLLKKLRVGKHPFLPFENFWKDTETCQLPEGKTTAFTETMRLLSITETHPVRRLQCAMAYFAMRGNYSALYDWVEHWLRCQEPLNKESNKNYQFSTGDYQ